MTGFSYASYFGPILPLADALREGEERCWASGTEDDKRPHDYVLYLGCNVLRTVNLAETIDAILRAMGVDFIALGGPANCCGIIHKGRGDSAIADAMLDRTLARFAAYRPKAVLTYCPSCHSRMDTALAEAAISFGVPYLHVSELIAGNLDRLRFPNRVERRVYLHDHAGAPQSVKDSAHIRAILGAIPGLELTGAPAEGDWGAHCSSVHIGRIGAARHAELAEGMFAAAKADGADCIATAYHSCYRALCRLEAGHGVKVIHYAALVAEGLGLPGFRDTFKELAIAGDPDSAMARLGERAAARGVDRRRLRAAVDSHFGPAR